MFDYVLFDLLFNILLKIIAFFSYSSITSKSDLIYHVLRFFFFFFLRKSFYT